MAYRGGELVDLAGPLEHGIDRFATRATREVGDELKARVRRHTPVAHPSAADFASYGGAAGWIEARHRRPRHLHDSWQVGEVEIVGRATGARRRVAVFTLDPVAPHVEWDTLPHLIVPRKPGGVLTVPTSRGMVFARLVHHPGTRGAHMMATALAEVAVMWRVTVSEQWAVETRRIWAGG